MRHGFHSRSRQRGISFIGLVFVAVVVACVLVVAAQVFPTVIEYQAVVKAVNKASAGNTVAEVRTIFDKAAQIDDISAITGKDLDITKNGDKVVVAFEYNKELHLVGPAYLLLKYSGRSR
jgi:hypothetical protein